MEGNITPRLGEFTAAPPAKRSVSKGRNHPYPFEDMARLAKTQPGEALLAAESVPINNIKSLREYRGAPFEDGTGYVDIKMRNSEVIEGVRHGDVYMTWTANNK